MKYKFYSSGIRDSDKYIYTLEWGTKYNKTNIFFNILSSLILERWSCKFGVVMMIYESYGLISFEFMLTVTFEKTCLIHNLFV